MESLVCRTNLQCLPSSTNTIKPWRRWRFSVSMTYRPRPLSSSYTSRALANFRTSALTSERSSSSLNFPNRTFLWRGRRCQAAFDDVEEAGTAVLVVGGGVLGMETVRALIDAGLLVAAYQRGERFDVPEMFHHDIEEMGWDVIDVTTIEKVLESNPFEAVVCTVGGGITQPNFDKDVPVKMVNAAKVAGVKRFVLVSSIGTGEGVKAVEKTLEEVAEEAVKSSELNYTIIRPGGLLSSPPTGNGILTQKSGISGLISRADVATLITEVLFNEESYGKTLTAFDEDMLLPPTASLEGVELK